MSQFSKTHKNTEYIQHEICSIDIDFSAAFGSANVTLLNVNVDPKDTISKVYFENKSAINGTGNVSIGLNSKVDILAATAVGSLFGSNGFKAGIQDGTPTNFIKNTGTATLPVYIYKDASMTQGVLRTYLSKFRGA